MESSANQARLFPENVVEGNQNLPETFRRLYYHLYTNSKASRAEVIIEDLSLLLLVKLALEQGGQSRLIDDFISGKSSADSAFLPILRTAYEGLIDSRQCFSIGDEALRKALREISGVRLTEAPSHALGEAFQALIGPRLRGERGQFFTPRSLVRAMVEIAAPAPSESVLDPACGTGGFLSETISYLRRNKSAAQTGELVGVDKDQGLSRLATAMLRVIAGQGAHIYNFNSLDLREWLSHLAHSYEDHFDVILTNPPFGTKIGLDEERLLKSFDFGHVWVVTKDGQWGKTNAILPSQDPQILFLEFCVRALKPGGRLGIVLPEGMFGNKSSGYIWDWLRERGEIFALLDCPRTTFQPGTDTKTNVLFFRKLRSDESRKGYTDVAVALHCGHDRRGRSHRQSGELHADDFPFLATDFHRTPNERRMWRTVSLADHYYLVPRYHHSNDDYTPEEFELLRGALFATLGQLLERGLISVRKGHEIGSEAYGTGDIPFVRTSDIANFEISCDPTKAVSEEIYARYAPEQRLEAGDILMVVDGRYRIGTTALLTSNNVRCVVQSHLRIMGTPNRAELEPHELLFALNLPSVKIRLRDLVFIQSTLGTLGARLLELRVPVLHGPGPWRHRVDAFKQALDQRDEILARLRSMTGEDIEL
jgi:type I restriction enzyme M protein